MWSGESMKNIYDYSQAELANYFISKGEKAFRAQQIFTWLYQKKVSSFEQIKNIKQTLLTELAQDFSMQMIELVEKKSAKNAEKYLFRLDDNHKIEAVLLKQNYGNSLCVSTQVGCNMGCRFCQSAQTKKIRDLAAYEMVQQLLLVEAHSALKITHVVLMGIGEPFDNYDNVMRFIDIINNPYGLKIGARHITVSTCGIIPQIAQFALEDKQVNLAISLNAPNNKLRNQLMPINKTYPLEQLISCLQQYFQQTGRRITFEYIMLAQVNDQAKHARELVVLAKNLNCYINLIPYNQTENSQFWASDDEQIRKFYDIIKKAKINVTIRKEIGSDIWAACGQLRARSEED